MIIYIVWTRNGPPGTFGTKSMGQLWATYGPAMGQVRGSKLQNPGGRDKSQLSSCSEEITSVVKNHFCNKEISSVVKKSLL